MCYGMIVCFTPGEWYIMILKMLEARVSHIVSDVSVHGSERGREKRSCES